MVYDDRRQPLALHEGFHALLAESPYVADHAPEFHHYLDAYPRQPLAGVTDVIYWSVQEFGLRPLTTVTHASVYRRAPGSEPRTVIAMKQIYASHYFHAALQLIEVFEDRSEFGGPRAYLVYLDRSLFDTALGGLTRRTVERRLQGNLASRLNGMRNAASASSR